jgi:antagonist of KipI
MNLRVIKAGVLDTIQDMGRYGWQHLGINPGGSMDKWSAQLANILVGNNRDDAVIELHFPASEFFFEQPALIALAGADFTANLNGEEISCGQPILVSRYSILQFYRIKKGARAYLAVHGGFDIPRWLNSFSTHLKATGGGYNGRALQKDDEISIHPVAPGLSSLLDKKEYHILPWKTDTNWNENENEIIEVLPGNEWNRLDQSSQAKFCSQSFRITPQSDRMGYRLAGEKLSSQTDEEVVSYAVSFGTVQLLPDEQLIVLMADHQTTGGYPRIAHVITAHHPSLAQKRAGDSIYFRVTDHQRAEELLQKQQQYLQQVQNACKFRFDETLNT